MQGVEGHGGGHLGEDVRLEPETRPVRLQLPQRRRLEQVHPTAYMGRDECRRLVHEVKNATLAVHHNTSEVNRLFPGGLGRQDEGPAVGDLLETRAHLLDRQVAADVGVDDKNRLRVPTEQLLPEVEKTAGRPYKEDISGHRPVAYPWAGTPPGT